VVSGTDIHRPRGQYSTDKTNPSFGETQSLDFELEIGTVIGKDSKMGYPVKVNEAEDYIFGYTLLNDWSCRDVLAWEIQPLGPLNSKNFGTSISPWIISSLALEPFKKMQSPQDPEPLSYLKPINHFTYDIDVTVDLLTSTMKDNETILKSNFTHMYWTPF
jgi:fumarylacetoacetase